MGLVVVLVAIGVPVGETIGLTGHHHHRAAHHHPNMPLAIIVPMVAVVLAIGVGFLVLRGSMRNPEGRFAPPIAAGLPRRRRRQVGRNIRRGTPGDDPTTAGVERETAQRLVSQARFSTIVFVIAIGGEAAEAATQTSTLARVFFSVAVVMFVSFFAFNLWMVKRATQYLAQVDGADA